jgi:hypothetical protein
MDGGATTTGLIRIAAPVVDFSSLAGRPISIETASGPMIAIQEATFGTPTMAFFGKTPLVQKPTISGSKGGNVALGNLLTALAGLGLINDSTT